MNGPCPKCGGTMVAGVTSAVGLVGGLVHNPEKPWLKFVVLGTPTSANPIKAFGQGLEDEPGNAGFLIRGIRCGECGFLELYATDPTLP